MKPLLDEPPAVVSTRIRTAALLTALLAAAIYLATAEDRYNNDAAYVGALFVAAALGILAGAGLAAGERRFGRPVALAGWVMGAVTALGMAVSFVLSRTVGLPSYHHHSWPPVMVVALVAEIAFLAFTATALGRLGRPRD